jgi:LAO/AO transport system kinase
VEGAGGQAADLAERVVRGDLRAAARAARLVDDRTPGYRDLLRALYPRTGRAWILGVTGTPGAGKSTLTDRLVARERKRGRKVGVIAVDPTSPFSGGAILGDRIRMQRHFLDPGVFIRSLATRGHLGGLSRSAGDVLHVLDAFGCDTIVVETVGVGQDELEVTRLAHTTVVVTTPGMGDDVQAIKAGILEVADVFVVNKADRDGADATVRDLEHMLALGEATGAAVSAGHGATYGSPGGGDLGPDALAGAADAHGVPARWRPPIVRTVASRDEGVDELLAACDRHRAHLEGTDEGRRRALARAKEELDAVFREALLTRAYARLGEELAALPERLLAHVEDPYGASDRLVRALLGDRGEPAGEGA